MAFEESHLLNFPITDFLRKLPVLTRNCFHMLALANDMLKPSKLEVIFSGFHFR
jgi:hypothetical protein